MNDLLKKSFANVKRDTTNIFQWINYFYRKSVEQEQLVKRLQLELSYMPRTRDDIRRIIDDYYSFEGIMSRIRELNGKVEALAVEGKARGMPCSRCSPQREITDLSHIEKRLHMLEQKKP